MNQPPLDTPVLEPGIHNVPADTYHADPASTPSLSASIAHKLITYSPRHAWTDHPRLNPHYERKTDDKFDLGTVVHALLLEGEDKAHVVHATSWRTNDAKEARDQARAAGLIPMLADQRDEVARMLRAVRPKVDTMLEHGRREVTLVWDEDGVTCRSRLDYLADDHALILDLKTTGKSANPELWSPFGIGADLQAAFYIRGVRALTGADAEYRWVIIETQPPYEVSVCAPTPATLALADAKVTYAIDKWRDCCTRNEWPGYREGVAYIDPKPWMEAAWLEREARESEVAA